ncbi:MAG: hydrolase [Gammaproteobacteria bacterium]
MPSRDFRSAWWLPSGHCQTLWAALARREPLLALHRERFELADGDFLDLDWTDNNGTAVVLVLHGLEGSARSPYVRALTRAVYRRGWRAACLHFRSCSGEPNRCSRLYHSGETGDLDAVVTNIRRRYPGLPLAVVGYSLGGNVLLKWLGEKRGGAPLAAAVAVSVPFRLDLAVARLNTGLSRIYQWWLLRSLRKKITARLRADPGLGSARRVTRWQTLREFDEEVTAPLYGFGGADDYYRQASSLPYLRCIETPTLILQATDDPFIPPTAIPAPEDLAHAITLEISHTGGHVGFVAGCVPGKARYWLDERIPEYLSRYL